MTIPVPQPTAIADLSMTDGAVIRIRRHGNPVGPRLVMSHGNGMAMNAYAGFWAPLTEQYEVVLFDFRNHGENPFHGSENHNYRTFVADMETVRRGIAQEFGAKPTAGVFHSLSAITCALHGLAYGKSWEAVVLFDPPFHPSLDHPYEPTFRSHMNAIATRTRRRPTRYKSIAAFARQLETHPAFGRWEEGAHALFARATLRRDPATGDYGLACPRELEAFVFIDNAETDLWPRMAGLPRPALMICGDPEFEFSMPETTVSSMMAREAGIEYAIVPGTDHFLQLEKPAEVASLMCAFLAREGLTP